jgi:hypothetical protein
LKAPGIIAAIAWCNRVGGKFWVRINDDAHQYALPLQITADPRIYGTVYLGTHGRGVLCGDPAE